MIAPPSRLPGRALLLIMLLLSSAHAAHAQDDGFKCRQGITKAYASYTGAALKAFQKCNDTYVKSGTGSQAPGLDPNVCGTAGAKHDGAASKLSAMIVKACGTAGVAPADIGWPATCPTFEGLPACFSVSTATSSEVGLCLGSCIGTPAMKQLLGLAYRDLVDGNGDAALVTCQRTIGKEITKLLLTRQKVLAGCRKAADAGKAALPCPDPGDGKALAKLAKAGASYVRNVCAACGSASTDGTTCAPGGLAPATIGMPSTCPAVTRPGSGVSCAATLATLDDLVQCGACYTAFTSDCLDAITRPDQAAYPPECEVPLPTPTPTATSGTPGATTTPTATTTATASATTAPTATRTTTPTPTPTPTRTASATITVTPTPIPTITCHPTAWGSPGTALGEFTLPFGIAVDGGTSISPARISVADSGNHRIQLYVQGTDVWYWFFGVGTGLPLDTPFGLAAHSGRYFVGDNTNNRILKTDGSNVYFATGSFGSGNGQFDHPRGIAVNFNGSSVFVADNNNNRVQRFSASDGTYQGQWGTLGTGDGEFNILYGIAADSTYVYVVDRGNHRIQKFTASGAFVTKWGTLVDLFSPAFIAVDSTGSHVFVADQTLDRVTKYTTTGTLVARYDLPAGSEPTGVALESNTGGILVTEVGSGFSRVERICPGS